MLWHGPEFAHELRYHLPCESLLLRWPYKVLDERSEELPCSTLLGLQMMQEPLKLRMALWALAYRLLMFLLELTRAFTT